MAIRLNKDNSLQRVSRCFSSSLRSIVVASGETRVVQGACRRPDYPMEPDSHSKAVEFGNVCGVLFWHVDQQQGGTDSYALHFMCIQPPGLFSLFSLPACCVKVASNGHLAYDMHTFEQELRRYMGEPAPSQKLITLVVELVDKPHEAFV